MKWFGCSMLIVVLTIFLWPGLAFCVVLPGVPPGFFPPDVEKFIGGRFIEGVSPESVRKLDKSSVVKLVEALDRRSLESYHSRIISALGIIGDVRARSPLVNYIESPSGPISLERFTAMLGAPLALGRLAAQGDKESLEYLLRRSSVENWSGLRWLFLEAGDLQGVFLTRAVLNGLGVSGRPEALRRLEELRGRDDKILQESIEDNIILNKRVASEGLASVDKSSKRRFSCTIGESGEVVKACGSSGSSIEPVRKIVTQPLTIVRHIAVPVNRKDLDKALEEASGLLQVSSRNNDYDCPVEFSMAKAGPINFFGEFKDGDSFVQVESQLLRILCRPDARIKLVGGISGYNLCETKGDGSFAGCAEEPGKNIIMVPSTLGDIWAHEFGHNQGLHHRSDSIYAVMHPTAPGTDEVNVTECVCMQENGRISKSVQAKGAKRKGTVRTRCKD